ncbi:MAG: DNA-processing protein DprA, partial [Bacteroidota bacterium]
QIGAVLAKQLIAYCGSAEAVFKSKRRTLLKVPGIGPHLVDNIIKQDPYQLAVRELAFIEQHQIQPLYFLDDAYPYRLRQVPDCPILLYYKGTADLNHSRIVSIVGTRKPSPRGQAICAELVSELKQYGVLIISGLAYGVDITAHRQCLIHDIPTVGVLGHGLARIYPASHRNIARQMIAQGALLTEYTSDVEPKRAHFPMRNRIVAGLCDALIVIETAKKGGSIITAELANAYNKDVFAIPGRLSDAKSQGCLHLIKTHRAALMESAKDIAYVMRWEKKEDTQEGQQQLFAALSTNEKSIIQLLKQTDYLGIDHLSAEMKMSTSDMAHLLLEMEFKGMIKTLPG